MSSICSQAPARSAWRRSPRGAASLTAVENEADVRGVLRANIEALGCADRATRRRRRRDPPAAGSHGLAISLCWIRPIAPGSPTPTLTALVEGGWLDDEATVVVEHGVDDLLRAVGGAHRARISRRYGRTALTFLSPAAD